MFIKRIINQEMENLLYNSFTMGIFFSSLSLESLFSYMTFHMTRPVYVSTMRFSYEIYYIWFPGKSL